MIRNLIRKFLLQEEVFGAQAFVYHGSDTPPNILVPALLNDEFTPGTGAGDLYGKGLYTVYDLSKSQTGNGRYGKFIYKIKVNLNDFLSFDPEITKLIYKSDLSLEDQAKKIGLDSYYVDKISQFNDYLVDPTLSSPFSSDTALKVSKFLAGHVKGIIYTGKNDGRCALIYDPSIAVPVAWKTMGSSSWTQIDRESIKPALRRSSTGEWESLKYFSNDPIAFFNKLKKAPIEKRIWRGNLNFDGLNVTSLPEGLVMIGNIKFENCQSLILANGLKIQGSLEVRGEKIPALPENLHVTDNFVLVKTNIAKLPDGLTVGGGAFLNDNNLVSLGKNSSFDYLQLLNSGITSLPDDLKVATLDLNHSNVSTISENLKVTRSLILGDNISELPKNLEINGDFKISMTKLSKLKKFSKSMRVGGNFIIHGDWNTIVLPESLSVGGDVVLTKVKFSNLPIQFKSGGSVIITPRPEITEVPENFSVGKSLDLAFTKIVSIGKNLKVGTNLDISGTKVKSIPSGVVVGDSLDITGCEIYVLPHDLKVGRYIYGYKGQKSDLPESISSRLFFGDYEMEKIEF
jgi:hypothetical protein